MARSSAHSPLRRTWSIAWKTALGLVLLGMIGLVISVGVTRASLPSYSDMMKSPNGQAVRVKSADGAVLVSVGPSYGAWLRYEEIPAVMSGAMIAVEDRRFFKHPGIDPLGLARAVYVSMRSGERIRATSTITQQLARNIFLTNDRSLPRKAREALLALALERKFNKRQILELYLNRVYFGGGAYGIDAASRRFFGHSATELSPAEAAIIAGLVKAPSRFAPSSDPELARRRAATVAEIMALRGVVPEAAPVRKDVEELTFAPQPRQNDVRYFTDWVLAQVDELVTERVEPLVVTTTLISSMQIAAEKAIKEQTPEGAQGALVAMSHDGAVRAMMGGRDYVDSNYNRAVVAERQPGSAWKLFVYLAAIEGGTLPDDVVYDEPVRIEGWSPRNYGGAYRGPVTVRQALATSSNVVAVQLAARQGFSSVANIAKRFGIETPVSTRPAMALGASTVRLIEMTSAYAAVARGGVSVEPYGITRVETARGRVLYEHQAPPQRVLVAPWVATNMTHLLENAVETGTGRAARIGRPVAGKTGTTNSNRDGYFVGFTGDLTAGVWMGRDDNQRVAGLQGGRAPTRAFAQFMRAATKGMPVTQLNSDIRIDDTFPEPDMAVYGLDGDWPPEEDYYYDEYSWDPAREPRYGEPYPAPRPDLAPPFRPDPFGDADVDVDYGQERPGYRRGERELNAADIPTRPRAPRDEDSWLDRRTEQRAEAPLSPPPIANPPPAPRPASPAAPATSAPTPLFPPDSM